MKDYIENLYEALKKIDVDKCVDIVSDIRNSKIEQKKEDIVRLCKLFTEDFDYMEPAISLEITRMIFWAIDKGEVESGLKELAKGLLVMYMKDPENIGEQDELDDYFYDILCMFIGNYEEQDMIILGQQISSMNHVGFAKKILEVIKTTLDFNDREVFIKNESVLEKNIVIKNELGLI